MASDVRQPLFSQRVAQARGALHRFVPANFSDPFGLAVRLLRSGSPEARAAMGIAALSAVATPIDVALQPLEQRLYAASGPPRGPLVFVCGPPRSGTTVVAQTLTRLLPVAYITNLSAVFPRSPITAARLYHKPLRNSAVTQTSYYGRTRHLWGINDGLHLWDRWVGSDRRRIPARIGPPEAQAMARFFGAYERQMRRPVLNKNNSLNTFAHLVAEVLPTAVFVCMDRDPLFLAQSLLQASRLVHGDPSVPYGVHAPGGRAPDPFATAAEQVAFHRACARRQAHALGDRFWLVSYEDFCAEPAAVVDRVARQVLGVDVGGPALDAMTPYTISRRRTLPEPQFTRLERALSMVAL